MTVAEEKARLRQQVRAELAALTPVQRAEASRLAVERLINWPVYQAARTVLLTASLPDELDLTPLIDLARGSGKRCALPAFDPALDGYVAREWDRPVAALSVGRFGIREPDAGCPVLPVPVLDLIVVPGVAFDQSGARIGRGKGYFDRLLSRSTVAVSCGVGFEQQCVPKVPMEPHDVQLAYILTPSRVVDCRALGL